MTKRTVMLTLAALVMTAACSASPVTVDTTLSNPLAEPGTSNADQLADNPTSLTGVTGAPNESAFRNPQAAASDSFSNQDPPLLQPDSDDTTNDVKATIEGLLDDLDDLDGLLGDLDTALNDLDQSFDDDEGDVQE
jgi:ABC-type glycerol-3-phosphate transport system substrate-binding protein